MVSKTSDDDGARPDAARSARVHGAAPEASALAAPSRKHWAEFDQFSDRERRIMHLAARGYASKEIAGLESDTENAVSQVIKRIRAKCGGAGRRDLARDYIAWEIYRKQEHESDSVSQTEGLLDDPFLVDQNMALVGQAETASQDPSVHRDDAERETVSEPVLPDDPIFRFFRSRLPVGIGGSGRNDLGKNSLTFMIFVIATLSVFLAGAILNLLFTADHLQIGH
jgi:DNA-binding CsgD family transcriptional regulator